MSISLNHRGFSDELADALLHLSLENNSSLLLIKSLLRQEFELKSKKPKTILRGGSVVGKLIGAYMSMCELLIDIKLTNVKERKGSRYLIQLIGDLVLEVKRLHLFGKRFSIRPQSGSNTQISIGKLRDVCQRFINRITSEELISQMPREIKSICFFVVEFGGEFNLDSTIILPLLSEFLVTKFIGPAITFPHIYNITNNELNETARKNVTYVMKVLQKWSCLRFFQEKIDDQFVSLNNFLEDNHSKMFRYVHLIAKDPENKGIFFCNIVA